MRKSIEQLKAEAAENRMQVLATKHAERKAAATLVCNHEDTDKQIFLGNQIREGRYGKEIWYCKICGNFYERG